MKAGAFELEKIGGNLDYKSKDNKLGKRGLGVRVLIRRRRGGKVKFV